MEDGSNTSDIRTLIEAIKASDVLESRISLLSKLGDLHQPGASNVTFLVESLAMFWENSTRIRAEHCVLNKTLLNVAANYLESDASNCLTQFLILGTKASTWCGKHLQMTAVSLEDIGDVKHPNVFPQLILDSLRFSSATIAVLTRFPILGDKVEMLIVESFIFELLHLTKASMLEIKKIQSIASEVVKVAQLVLDNAIKLCRAYSQAMKLESKHVRHDDDEGVDYASHVISITACTVNILYELGTFAASGGGSLVSVLNLSWKGVVSLLQLVKGASAEKINVGEIILNLVSLASESLRCAAEAWSSSVMESVPISEAKRTLLPIKFFLINAVRISSEYPCEAVKVYEEITLCVLVISSLGAFLSQEAHLRSASEALAEVLEPTSFLLIHTLLTSADVKPDSRVHILDWLFPDEISCVSNDAEEDFGTAPNSTSLDSIFAMSCDARPRRETLLLGRVILFLNLLKTSQAFREEVLIEFSRKLECLLLFLQQNEVYSSVLGLHVPVPCGSGSSQGIVWQPMFIFMLHALKTFMVVASSSLLAWMEVQYFLLQNFLHPHSLCLEIVMELGCFLIRHADLDLVNHIIEKLFSLLRMIASSEPSLGPLCALRKMARSICILLNHATPSVADQVYTSIVSCDKSYMSSIIYTALLMEGFPLDSLSDSLKLVAAEKIASAFHDYTVNYSEKLVPNISPGSSDSDSLGLPLHALTCALRSCHIKKSHILDEKCAAQVLNFTHTLIQRLKNAPESMKDSYAKLLTTTLDFTANMSHLYGSDKMGTIIFELKTLFAVDSKNSDAFLYQCKPSLASFMAGVCHLELSEVEGGALCSAVWDLYHVLLRERHWALIHLSVAAFGYFAARTSLTELWRFIPPDAALSYDKETGSESNEERFMSELKGFLEKEAALHTIITCKRQLIFLSHEGLLLKKVGKVTNITSEISGPEIVKVDNETCLRTRKRKLPDGIQEGIELMHNGLKVMTDALAEPDSSELKDAFSAHISCLEDVISQLAGLSHSVNGSTHAVYEH